MPKQEDLSNVPASVLKQQRDAERKIEALTSEPTPDPVQNTEPNQSPEPTTEQEPVKTENQEPVKQVVEPAIVDDQTSGQWEHKYKVLQGKYDKEVGDLRGEVASLKSMMERQTKIIDGLESSNNNAPEKSIDLEDLDLEAYEGWGDEMKPLVTQVNTLKAIIKDQAAVIDGLRSNPQADDSITERINSLESESREARVSKYLETLDNTINGNWRQLNVDAGFNAWLNESDPMSMMVRRNLLEAAAENLRGAQVASIFNQYIGSQGKSQSKVSVASELPDGSGSGDDTPAPKASVTEADVKKAQQDFIRGRITEDEYDKVYAKFQRTLRR